MWFTGAMVHILEHLYILRVVANMLGSSFIFRHGRKHTNDFPPREHHHVVDKK
jgi:hypothetical protein